MIARTRFGLAVENFTPSPAVPEIGSILEYARRAEELGFGSLWVWDHILLGSKHAFPFLESLSVLATLSVTTKEVVLGTGVLVLPLRNPVLLAKVTATIDRMSNGRLTLGVAAGWYEREFDAVGVPFAGRGKVFLRNLDVLNRFWTQERVDGSADEMTFKGAVMLPPPIQRPRPTVLFGGYVDRVLRRVATLADGWLTYFYPAESFGRAWRRILGYAEEAGRDPAAMANVAQLPICVDDSYERADERVRAFLGRSFDMSPWSESSPDSAIRGTPDQCAEQLAAHVEAGVQHIVLVPCEYDHRQMEWIASDIAPKFAALDRSSVA